MKEKTKEQKKPQLNSNNMKPFRGLNIIVELRKIQKGKPYKNHIQTYRTTSQLAKHSASLGLLKGQTTH